MLSLAELWRKGQPYAARVPGASIFATLRRRSGPCVGSDPPPHGRPTGRPARCRQAFFGDLDDKYLPTFHSLRLVLRAGVAVPRLATSLVYSLVLIAQNYFDILVHRIIGGHEVTFWVRWEPLLDLVQNAPFETLRLCLLAVAFRRCLELFQQRVATPAPRPKPCRPARAVGGRADGGCNRYPAWSGCVVGASRLVARGRGRPAA